MRFELVAPLLCVLLLACSDAMSQLPGNGNGNGHAKDAAKKASSDRLRGRIKLPRRDDSAPERHVGPNFDPSKMRNQHGNGALRRAAKQDERNEVRRKHVLHQQQPAEEDTTQPPADATNRGPHRRSSVEALHQLRQQMRSEMAEIDRMRDTAIETGDLQLLEQAEGLEQALRLRYRQAFREWHLQHDNGNHYGWERGNGARLPAPPTNPPGSTPTDPVGGTPTDPTGLPPTDPTAGTPTDPTGGAPTDPTGSTPTDPAGSTPTDPSGSPPIDPAPTDPLGGTPIDPPVGTTPPAPPSEPLP